MPGSNCVIVNCGTSRYQKEISLVKLPTLKDVFPKKWQRDMLNIITRDHETDANLNQQSEKDTVHICEKHFSEEQVRTCEFYVYLIFILAFDVSAPFAFGRLFDLCKEVPRSSRFDNYMIVFQT